MATGAVRVKDPLKSLHYSVVALSEDLEHFSEIGKLCELKYSMRELAKVLQRVIDARPTFHKHISGGN